jgi:DNA-binding protein YbaB
MFDERQIDNWEASLAERAERARTVAQRHAALTAKVRDRDGLVEVTLGATGTLTNLVLDDRVRHQSAQTTSQQILAAVRTAQADLAQQAAQVTAEAYGKDSPTASAIMDSYRRGLNPNGAHEQA